MAIKKPRLERRPSIPKSEINLGSHSSTDSPPPSEAPDMEDDDGSDRSSVDLEQPQTPRERVAEELRKLDEFWSFKPIPRDSTLVVRQAHARTTISSASSSPIMHSPEVHSPSHPPPAPQAVPLTENSSKNTDNFEGRSGPELTTELVDIAVRSKVSPRLSKVPRKDRVAWLKTPISGSGNSTYPHQLRSTFLVQGRRRIEFAERDSRVHL